MIGDRIKRARLARGWSQSRLAKALGKAQTAVSSWEVGRTEPSRSEAARIAGFLGVGLAALEGVEEGGYAIPGMAEEAAPMRRGYPLIGKVGAGGEGLYDDDYAMGAAQDWIEPLPGMTMGEEIIVLDTEGDSMIPAVFDGDLAFFGPVRHDVEALLNKRVMARLADGRKFFKILKRGSGPGLWTLRSLNPATPDIEDVHVEWVLPYRGSRPRDI